MNNFRFEFKDLIQMMVYVILVAGAFFALDKRLALIEQKIDQMTQVMSASTTIINDHEKRITILEQLRK
jgi:hypothetical protein